MELANEFAISRATVYNLIQQAKGMGLEIHTVKGKGYRLVRSYEWLNEAMLRERLVHANRTMHLEVVDQVDSTNTRLMEYMRTGGKPSVLCAEYQTGGRGRRGRQWAAVPGGSLVFSLSWQFEQPVGELGGLSLAAGLAMARAMTAYSSTALELKWPNDVVSGYRKVAGILVEIQGEASGPSIAVIGVGVNLSLPKAVRVDIMQGVADLEELGWAGRRNDLLADSLDQLISMLEGFGRTGFAPLIDDWNGRHAYQDKYVNLVLPDGTKETGKVSGVDAGGGLLVEQESGGLRRYSCGEVSLRTQRARAMA
jgi:BirA family transcriptional regulator, biotin operon repressor / biotin---[acetyl-CoA-carboxylase] ligase